MTAHDIDLEALGRYDTPTICNALLAIAPEAAGRSTKAMLHCARPDLPPMVGFARTTLYRTLEPGSLDADAEKAQDLAWFDYVAADPEPRIVVVQDGDTPHAATNALFGEVMSFMHSALGCIGLVTNGAVRDVAGMAEGFQVLHGGIRPNRADYHRVDFDCEVNVAGLYARTDTLIHADVNGAVVVPPNLIPQILEAAVEVTKKERAIIDFCRDPDVTVDSFKRFWRGG
ncbi:MAG: RraA family protein [Rhodospirillales bacterium]|nr:RraA family protein [Rhodospirillales bacterium]